VSPFDLPPRRATNQGGNEVPTDLDELRHTRQQPNLARGIVWADVLAAIAADEEARQQRQLPEAA
jgi:hypothetical protein